MYELVVGAPPGESNPADPDSSRGPVTPVKGLFALTDRRGLLFPCKRQDRLHGGERAGQKSWGLIRYSDSVQRRMVVGMRCGRAVDRTRAWHRALSEGSRARVPFRRATRAVDAAGTGGSAVSSSVTVIAGSAEAGKGLEPVLGVEGSSLVG